jgi:hypothetical protein
VAAIVAGGIAQRVRNHGRVSEMSGLGGATAIGFGARVAVIVDRRACVAQVGILENVDFRPRFTSGVVGWCA